MRTLLALTLLVLGCSMNASPVLSQDSSTPKAKEQKKDQSEKDGPSTSNQDTPSKEKEKTGTITGTVEHSSAKKFPTVVYLVGVPEKESQPPEKPAMMNQKNKEFVPRVLPIVVGTTVEFHNNDDLEHNVFSPDGEKYELGNWGKGKMRSYTFKHTGVYTQLCKVHPEMVGYVVVCENRCFAVADAEGKFKMENVPAGNWKVKIWNERLKQRQLDKEYEVKVEDGKEAVLKIEP